MKTSHLLPLHPASLLKAAMLSVRHTNLANAAIQETGISTSRVTTSIISHNAGQSHGSCVSIQLSGYVVDVGQFSNKKGQELCVDVIAADGLVVPIAGIDPEDGFNDRQLKAHKHKVVRRIGGEETLVTVLQEMKKSTEGKPRHELEAPTAKSTPEFPLR